MQYMFLILHFLTIFTSQEFKNFILLKRLKEIFFYLFWLFFLKVSFFYFLISFNIVKFQKFEKLYSSSFQILEVSKKRIALFNKIFLFIFYFLCFSPTPNGVRADFSAFLHEQSQKEFVSKSKRKKKTKNFMHKLKKKSFTNFQKFSKSHFRDFDMKKNFVCSVSKKKNFQSSVSSEKNLNDFDSLSDQMVFLNYPLDKGRLKNIVCWFFDKHGQYKTLKFLEKLKEFGFGFATTAGISLGIDDLRIPNQKISLLATAETKVAKDLSEYRNAKITGIERVQRLIYTWNQTNDTLKQEVVQHFEKTDLFNPIYMMAFSGARGNMSQVRQLVGMRGLMSDPQGQIIDFPIQSNFREGLTLTEYLISTYGARKGIVDTALRTATAGYLTRRLVDVAQHTIVSHFDCGTMRGIFLFDMKEGKKTIYSFQNRLVGRVLAQNIQCRDPEQKKAISFISVPQANLEAEKKQLSSNVEHAQNEEQKNEKKYIAFRNQEIDLKFAKAIAKVTKKAFVRSPLTCETSRFLCQLCYGWSFSHGKLVSVGEAVGIIAAQSIGEPGTQLTMRTFHTGGVFAGGLTDQILAPFHGKIQYFQSIPGSCVRTALSEIAFFTKMPGLFLLRRVDQKKEMEVFEQEFSYRGAEQISATTEKFYSTFGPVDEYKKKFKQEKKNSNFSEVFRIPAYALLFCRNNEFVQKKQVLAQFSSVLKKVQYGTAEQTLFSTFPGEFVFGNSFFEQKKKLFLSEFHSFQFLEKKRNSNPKIEQKQNLLLEQRNGDFSELELKYDSLWKSQNWSTIWILSGKIFYNSFDTKFWIQEGDSLKRTSVLNRVLWRKTKKFQYSLVPLKNEIQRKNKQRFSYLFSFEKSRKFRFSPSLHCKSEDPYMGKVGPGQKKQSRENCLNFSVSFNKKQKNLKNSFFLTEQPIFVKTKSLTDSAFVSFEPDQNSQKNVFFCSMGKTKNFFFFGFEVQPKSEKANDILFFQNKANRFFANFGLLRNKLEFTFHPAKNEFDHQKKLHNFLCSPALMSSKKTIQKNLNLSSKNSLNSVFLKFAKKRKKEIYSSFLNNFTYSNVFKTSRKFGFFSFQFTANQKIPFPKSSSFFLPKEFQTFQKLFGFQHKTLSKSFHEIFKNKKKNARQILFILKEREAVDVFSFSPYSIVGKVLFLPQSADKLEHIQKQQKTEKMFKRKIDFQTLLCSSFSPFDFQNKKKHFHFVLKQFAKNQKQKKFFLVFGTKNTEKISKNILLKKTLFRLSVEKIRYQKFGYVSSFFVSSGDGADQKNENFTRGADTFRIFSTLKQNENDFDQNQNPGKKQNQLSFVNENFFGKEFPTFLSYSFFQNFQTKTSGLFSMGSFEDSFKENRLQNFLFFQNLKNWSSPRSGENLKGVFVSKQADQIKKTVFNKKFLKRGAFLFPALRLKRTDENLNGYIQNSYFHEILNFSEEQTHFLNGVFKQQSEEMEKNEEKKMKIFVASSLKKIVPFQLNTFSFLSPSFISFLTFFLVRDEDKKNHKISYIWLLNQPHKATDPPYFHMKQKNQKNSREFFEFQKLKFHSGNFIKLFPPLSEIQNQKTFFFTNSVSDHFKKYFLNLQKKQKNVSLFQIYTKEVFWLPQENFLFSIAQIHPNDMVWKKQKFQVSFQTKNEKFFFHSKETPFFHLVNRQGKKKQVSFQFDGIAKLSNIEKSKKIEISEKKKKKIQKFSSFSEPIQQKLSFSKNRKNKALLFQKNFASTFRKRIQNEKFEKIQKLFLNISSSLDEGEQKMKELNSFSKRKTLFKKKFLFSRIPQNESFTCIPLQNFEFFSLMNAKKKAETNFQTLQSFLEKKKMHLKVQSGWLYIPFSSFSLLKLHKKIVKKGSFFGHDLVFEQNTICSETVVLDSAVNCFQSQNLKNLKMFSLQILQKKTKKQFSFSVQCFQKNKKCRYHSCVDFIERKFEVCLFPQAASTVPYGGEGGVPILQGEWGLPLSGGNQHQQFECFGSVPKKNIALPFENFPGNKKIQKRTFFQFFRPFQYKLIENPKNAMKFFLNFQLQSFSVLFSSKYSLELYKKYHSTFLNCQKKGKVFLNQIDEKTQNQQIEFLSNFENMYFFKQQRKNSENSSFSKIHAFDNLEQKKRKIHQKNIKIKVEQKKNLLCSKALDGKKENLLASLGKMKSFSIHFNKKRNFAHSFYSFYPIQFLPFVLSFQRDPEKNFARLRESGVVDDSSKNVSFPIFSTNSLKNTIEYSLCEKKATFLDQKFTFIPLFENFVKTSSFWLNKDKMTFIFSFEKCKTNFMNFQFFQRKNSKQNFLNSKTAFFRNSIFKNSQEFYGSTQLLSPYEGEILSMVTHEMNWWEKASKISTLQKLEKLFTIVTKKDLFSVEFGPSCGQESFEKIELFFSNDQNICKTKQKNLGKLYQSVLSSQRKFNFDNALLGAEHLDPYFKANGNFRKAGKNKSSSTVFEKTTKISSFVTKYENKVYTFQNLAIGYPTVSKIARVGNFVFYGDCFFGSAIRKPGQVVHLSSKRMTLRRGQVFLVSFNGILHFSKIPYIRKNVPIVTLPYQTVQAGDIVQGIPKVEQFFEARITIQGRLFVSSLPILLKGIFERYKVLLPLEQATRQSFLKIQQIIVDGVQRVYRSQGVSITDKHLEIVVRQMTTKVQILHGAQTGFFPGELVHLDLVERLNKFLMVKIRYEPVILGITRASLEVDSFLSASSFQQTTKILSLAAISHKKDFLKGLKENLLVGNLIPAGTGYFTLTKTC